MNGYGDEGPAGVAPAEQFANAEEAWAIYDTIQIRKSVETKEGYKSYADMGAKDEWPFMDQRKSDIGLAYTNRDSNEGLEYVFHAHSLGIRFAAPQGIIEPDPGVQAPLGPSNPVAHLVFAAMLAEHIGVRVKIMQDDKLLHSVYLAPPGTGFVTATGAIVSAGPLAYSTLASGLGWPDLHNRWKWPGGLDIPRGATFSVRLIPSRYGKALCSSLPGPGDFTFCVDGQTPLTMESCALVRVDMLGRREVQQRNQLHR